MLNFTWNESFGFLFFVASISQHPFLVPSSLVYLETLLILSIIPHILLFPSLVPAARLVLSSVIYLICSRLPDSSRVSTEFVEIDGGTDRSYMKSNHWIDARAKKLISM